MNRKITGIFLSLVLGLGLVGCSSKDNATKPQENSTTSVEEEVQTSEEVRGDKDQALEELNVTYVTSPLNVPSIVEKQKQIFAESMPGVVINYKEITSGAEQTEALASGGVDILYALGGSSAILAKANGLDLKVLSMYSRAPKAFAMFANDDSFKDPESLKGKKIAGPVGTNLHQLLVAYLEKNDMTIDDVEFVNMSIPDALAALEVGSIDVALLGGPAAYQAENSGKYKIADGEGLIDAIICVATTNEFANAHPEIIEGLEKSQEEIASFMADEADQTKEMVMKELSLDQQAYDSMYQMYDFSTEITEKDKEGFQRTKDFMLNTNMIEKDLDIESLF